MYVFPSYYKVILHFWMPCLNDIFGIKVMPENPKCCQHKSINQIKLHDVDLDNNFRGYTSCKVTLRILWIKICEVSHTTFLYLTMYISATQLWTSSTLFVCVGQAMKFPIFIKLNNHLFLRYFLLKNVSYLRSGGRGNSRPVVRWQQTTGLGGRATVNIPPETVRKFSFHP